MRLGAGRPAASPEIISWRPLTEEEVANMRPAKSAAVTKLRDSHHRIARLLAAGLRYNEVAERTGYSYQRVATLAVDPAFIDLVRRYREDENASFYLQRDDYYELILSNGLKAERMIADRLDDAEEGEALPVNQLIAIARDAADRVGYGKRATQVNVNVDFAAQLDRAIHRSGKARIIEGTVSSSTPAVAHSPGGGVELTAASQALAPTTLPAERDPPPSADSGGPKRPAALVRSPAEIPRRRFAA